MTNSFTINELATTERVCKEMFPESSLAVIKIRAALLEAYKADKRFRMAYQVHRLSVGDHALTYDSFVDARVRLSYYDTYFNLADELIEIANG